MTKSNKKIVFRLPTIRQAIRFRIEQYGWTDTKFARKIGMMPSHFSEFMDKKRRLPLDARIKAYKLGVPSDVLLQRERLTESIRETMNLTPLWMILNGIAFGLGVMFIWKPYPLDPVVVGWMMAILAVINCVILFYEDTKQRKEK